MGGIHKSGFIAPVRLCHVNVGVWEIASVTEVNIAMSRDEALVAFAGVSLPVSLSLEFNRHPEDEFGDFTIYVVPRSVRTPSLSGFEVYRDQVGGFECFHG